MRQLRDNEKLLWLDAAGQTSKRLRCIVWTKCQSTVTPDEAGELFIMDTETVWVEKDAYPKRGFRGRFKNDKKEDRRVLLQDPSGDGDGTVPTSSSISLDKNAKRPPEPLGLTTEHEPAYKSEEARQFSIRAIAALCAKYYEQKRGKKIET